ncbi:uncharacterized protein F5Z01DRAFT_657412 [Emericellopsis atlantica]|uniref:protein-histidine N-methyltransferase n=1 Tax=Emericellopsis atlantica TaxID=2614577 RepID=A0A9P7ZK01_9HYPO|nr:uncharacterized protein F5Z01DRAFT_657412 [Emericellopsis atlantica]KAG9253519.1 hypothetical protein F5Z01DRAFT_657412 [Emericellopsis atlantica]
MAFSFGFSGDDIDGASDTSAPPPPSKPSAFPVAGKPQLPPTYHDLPALLSTLPSKIAFSNLDVSLDDGSSMQIPRRELWDVRIQLMAEDEGQAEGMEGLGSHDVKTGVYEGGFKSWESSLDLVKVLASGNHLSSDDATPVRIIELGCGTALPSLAMFQWSLASTAETQRRISFVIADYNPTVLQLVTLPNFVLSWALTQQATTPALQDAFAEDGELELSPEVINAFQAFLTSRGISLSFLSGGWSEQFVDLVYGQAPQTEASSTLVLGAETIYSPSALQAFAETTLSLLERERAAGTAKAVALVGAKQHYFGVGGSLEDFVIDVQGRGAIVDKLREETAGVRRGVVSCTLRNDFKG